MALRKTEVKQRLFPLLFNFQIPNSQIPNPQKAGNSLGTPLMFHQVIRLFICRLTGTIQYILLVYHYIIIIFLNPTLGFFPGSYSWVRSQT